MLNMSNVFKDFPLSNSVKKSIEMIGYSNATEVQALAIPEVMNNVDLVVKSNTGSGKTAAFGIPVVDKLKVDVRLPQVLILTPTRELAVQVSEEITNIGKYKKVRCLPIYGKQPMHIQINQLKQRVHIVVGTPGRVTDLIGRGHLKLEGISHLVIDEADELLNRGFLEEVKGIIEALPTDRNTLLFSATMPEEIEKVCHAYMKNPKWIDIKGDDDIPTDISQVSFEIAEEFKFNRLQEILEYVKPDSCLVFCNTQVKCDKVHGLLRKNRIKALTLHGGMNQRDRLKSIRSFKDKEVTFLVATDLAARGIHISALDLVVNYDIPIDKENYVHRIGRTGRAGEKGLAISFISQHDKLRRQEIEGFLEEKLALGAIDNLDKSIGPLLKEINGGNNSKSADQKSPKANGSTMNGKNSKQKDQNKQKVVDVLHKDIMKLRLSIGKNKKIRALDVVGAVGNIEGIKPDDIGIVDIRESSTYIDIFNNKGDLVLDELTTVKGKNTKIVKIRKPR